MSVIYYFSFFPLTGRFHSYLSYLKYAQIITKKSTDVQEIIHLCRHQSNVSVPLVVQHSLHR